MTGGPVNERTGLRGVIRACRLMAVAGLLLAAAEWIRADDAPPAPAQPPAPLPADPAVLERARVRAVAAAENDVVRLKAALETLSAGAAAATQALQAAEKQVASVMAEKTAAEQRIAAGPEIVKQLMAAQGAAEQVVKLATQARAGVAEGSPDAAQALAREQEAQAFLEVTKATLGQQQAGIKTATEAKPVLEARLVELMAGLKPLQEARGKAEAASQGGKARLDQAVTRAQAVAAGAVVFEPSRLQLSGTFTHSRSIYSSDISPDGQFVYAGADDNTLQRFSLFDQSQRAFTGHRSWVGAVCALPGEGTAVTGGYEGQLLFWSKDQPTPVRSIAAHKGFIRTVALSRNGQLLATAGNDKVIRLWSAVDGTAVAELPGHEAHLYSVGFHPDGQHLVSGDLMGAIKQWSLETRAVVREFDGGLLHQYDKTFQADCGGIRAIDFSPDGKLMAVGGMGDITNAFADVGKPLVLLFDWSDGKLVRKLSPAKAFQGSVWGLRFDPTGSYIAAAGGGAGGGLWVWKPDTEASVLDFPLPQPARGLQFHPDGLRVVVPMFDNAVRIYDTVLPPPAPKQ